MQVGVGHNYQLHAIGWKWKLTTCFGGDGVSRIRNKTSLGLCPGVDFRFCWRADYVLPEITGQVLDPSSVDLLERKWVKRKIHCHCFPKQTSHSVYCFETRRSCCLVVIEFWFIFCGVLCWLHITNVLCSLWCSVLVLWWFLGDFRVWEFDGFGWRGSLVSSVSGGFGSRPWQGRLAVVVGCLFGGGGCQRSAAAVVILFWIGIRGVGLGLTFWAWPGPFTFELYFHI